MGDPSAVFLAYDIRGLVPEHLDADLARRIGGAFARLVRRREPDTGRVVLGRDMRESGVELAGAFADGVTAEGLNVVDLGLVST
ncbi:MAG: phosphomannomutase/phosphoglucomutase, partial [Acidimicrobiales bacterium]|nr:phosphomannomutase/phosphoglucomutase [Acidimicrobiales bacterium]